MGQSISSAESRLEAKLITRADVLTIAGDLRDTMSHLRREEELAVKSLKRRVSAVETMAKQEEAQIEKNIAKIMIAKNTSSSGERGQGQVVQTSATTTSGNPAADSASSTVPVDAGLGSPTVERSSAQVVSDHHSTASPSNNSPQAGQDLSPTIEEESAQCANGPRLAYGQIHQQLDQPSVQDVLLPVVKLICEPWRSVDERQLLFEKLRRWLKASAAAESSPLEQLAGRKNKRTKAGRTYDTYVEETSARDYYKKQRSLEQSYDLHSSCSENESSSASRANRGKINQVAASSSSELILVAASSEQGRTCKKKHTQHDRRPRTSPRGASSNSRTNTLTHGWSNRLTHENRKTREKVKSLLEQLHAAQVQSRSSSSNLQHFPPPPHPGTTSTGGLNSPPPSSRTPMHSFFAPTNRERQDYIAAEMTTSRAQTAPSVPAIGVGGGTSLTTHPGLVERCSGGQHNGEPDEFPLPHSSAASTTTATRIACTGNWLKLNNPQEKKEQKRPSTSTAASRPSTSQGSKFSRAKINKTSGERPRVGGTEKQNGEAKSVPSATADHASALSAAAAAPPVLLVEDTYESKTREMMKQNQIKPLRAFTTVIPRPKILHVLGPASKVAAGSSGDAATGGVAKTQEVNSTSIAGARGAFSHLDDDLDET
ncbi:unnamed protein product [Amoebophrya sp. A120]|nr:unnamed protein product [Amoebophrya sp. A120]|eukprot:GSA120T00018773001.1